MVASAINSGDIKGNIAMGKRKEEEKKNNLPIVPTNTSKGPLLMYAALPKSMSLMFPSPSRITFSSLMSR
jgi:hypothetical protein